MARLAYPVTNLSLPRRRNAPAPIEDRCYGTCNAAFIKGQVSRDWEDFCDTGSAFYDYYHDCLCCVGETLRAKGSAEHAADYLAADFAGILSQCGVGSDNPYRDGAVADPCSIPLHEVASKVPMMPFPTATVQAVHPPADSLAVGVSITVPLRQLRSGQSAVPTAAPPMNQYTNIAHTTTAWVTTTDAQSHVATHLLRLRLLWLRGGPSRAQTIGIGAGAGAGCGVTLLLFAALLFWLHRRRKKRRKVEARRSAIALWNHRALSPQSTPTTPKTATRVGAAGRNGEYGDKAQLHGEELDGREIPPPPPQELPAEEVMVRRTEDGALISSSKERGDTSAEEMASEDEDSSISSEEDMPPQEMGSRLEDTSESSEDSPTEETSEASEASGAEELSNTGEAEEDTGSESEAKTEAGSISSKEYESAEEESEAKESSGQDETSDTEDSSPTER
ncbi:D-threonine aldolase [Apiospora arundinis]